MELQNCHDGVRLDNPTVRLDLDNEPQPDAICSLMPVLVDSPFWEKMDISEKC